jgi:energy-coupling factor transporter ATP-binding protein EcfA2
MEKGKAILLVGRRQWGKSTTLKALADNSSHTKIITINGHRVFIRHTSNDDVLPNDPQSFSKFISSRNPLSDPNVVIAFCPNFDSDAPEILATLQKNYELLFWVIKHSQNPKALTATPIDKELKEMDRYGKVEVFEHKAAKAEEIADELRRFIERLLPAAKK